MDGDRDLEEGLKHFEYLWTTEREEWVLVGASEDRLLPGHPSTRSVLLIDEDDELAQAVVARMRAEGIPVFVGAPPWATLGEVSPSALEPPESDG